MQWSSNNYESNEVQVLYLSICNAEEFVHVSFAAWFIEHFILKNTITNWFKTDSSHIYGFPKFSMYKPFIHFCDLYLFRGRFTVSNNLSYDHIHTWKLLSITTVWSGTCSCAPHWCLLGHHCQILRKNLSTNETRILNPASSKSGRFMEITS